MLHLYYLYPKRVFYIMSQFLFIDFSMDMDKMENNINTINNVLILET